MPPISDATPRMLPRLPEIAKSLHSKTQIQTHTSSVSTRAKLGRQAELYTCSSHANCGGRGVSERGPLSVPETHGHR